MATRRDFRVLVASDGSLAATAAVVTTTSWPWPAGTRAFGIVAQPPLAGGRSTSRATTTRAAEDVRTSVEQALERRWRDARVWRYPGEPTAVIVRQAKRTRADLIIMGWRGHGVMRRLLVGSVSRGVVRHAPCSVLVVRRASRRLRHVVLGYDGSPNAGRTIDFTARLVPPGTHITLVMAVRMMEVPSRRLVGATTMGTVRSEVVSENTKRMRLARRLLEKAARPFRDAGCEVDYLASEKAPLQALLAACASADADVLALGATGATGLRGLLVGSVAQGALDRSRTPVLIVR